MLGIKKGKIFISCCSNRNPEWGTALSIQDSMRVAAKAGWTSVFRPRAGESLICRARQNDLVEFMQNGADFLFSVDDDVLLPPDVLEILAGVNKDVVGGVYRLGYDNPVPAVRLPKDGPMWNDVMNKGMLTPALYVSTGCMMVKRYIIEGMIEKYPDLHYRRNMTKDIAWALYQPFVYQLEYLSEDWAFCQRARDAGFEVWVHSGVRCGHMKKKLYMFGD